MKRRKITSAAAAVCLLSVLMLTSCSMFSRHKDITGVTTLPKENTVVMNSPSDGAFVNGSGNLTVKDGEMIHLKYELSSGSFDLAFHPGNEGLAVFESADLENLPSEGDVFGRSGIEGSGELDIEAPAGEYTVFFNMHSAVGSATAGTVKK